MAEQDPRVAALMAHPDDAEILAGGTLLRLVAAGWDAVIITMTAGDCGSSETTSDEISRIRHAEAEAAAAALGARYACAGLADVEVFANAESVCRVVELLRRYRPDMVITHSPSDYMLDHEETARIVRGATFAAAMPLYQTRQVPPAVPAPSTPALYYADAVEGIGPLGQRVYPAFYVDISGQLAEKRRLVACHVSQRAWLRRQHGIDEYLDRMTEWAAAYGRECGVAHAEGFRQHLGHGYPREPRLQHALEPYLRTRGEGRAPVPTRSR